MVNENEFKYCFSPASSPLLTRTIVRLILCHFFITKFKICLVGLLLLSATENTGRKINNRLYRLGGDFWSLFSTRISNFKD